MKTFNRSMLTTVTATVSLALAACGGSSGSSSSDTAAAPADTTAASVEAASPDTTPPGAPADTTAPGAQPAGEGPAGLDVSAAPLCQLVTTEDLQKLFGDTKFKNPDYSSNSCSLFATEQTGGFSTELALMPMMVGYADHIPLQKELGAVVEPVSGIGDEASWLTFDAAGFQPSRDVVFRKGDITYTVKATFIGVPPADPATAKAVLVPLAEKFAAAIP